MKYFYRFLYFFIIIIVLSQLTNCSSIPSCCLISSPRINMTGEMTIVERQIVGDYKEIEKDAWTVSSVKKTVQRAKGSRTLTAGDRELFMALKVMEFHQDKIKTYKKKGYMGESNKGYLQYIKSSNIERNKEEKEILISVIDNENDARKILFTRMQLKTKKKKPTNEEIEGFGRIFAQEQRAKAQKSEWIQDESGRWRQK